MKFIAAILGFIFSLPTFAAKSAVQCHAESFYDCHESNCTAQPNSSVAFTLRGSQADLCLYSVCLKGPASLRKSKETKITGFLIDAKGKTVSGETVTVFAAGHISPEGHFDALMDSTRYEGTCE